MNTFDRNLSLLLSFCFRWLLAAASWSSLPGASARLCDPSIEESIHALV